MESSLEGGKRKRIKIGEKGEKRRRHPLPPHATGSDPPISLLASIEHDFPDGESTIFLENRNRAHVRFF